MQKESIHFFKGNFCTLFSPWSGTVTFLHVNRQIWFNFNPLRKLIPFNWICMHEMAQHLTNRQLGWRKIASLRKFIDSICLFLTEIKSFYFNKKGFIWNAKETGKDCIRMLGKGFTWENVDGCVFRRIPKSIWVAIVIGKKWVKGKKVFGLMGKVLKSVGVFLLKFAYVVIQKLLSRNLTAFAQTNINKQKTNLCFCFFFSPKTRQMNKGNLPVIP